MSMLCVCVRANVCVYLTAKIISQKNTSQRGKQDLLNMPSHLTEEESTQIAAYANSSNKEQSISAPTCGALYHYPEFRVETHRHMTVISVTERRNRTNRSILISCVVTVT